MERSVKQAHESREKGVGRVRVLLCVRAEGCIRHLWLYAFTLPHLIHGTPVVLLLHSQGDILRAVDGVDVLNMKQV